MFDSLKAVRNVQIISHGGVAPLSKKQIVGLIINLPDANKNLTKDEFNKIYQLYQTFRKDTTKSVLDYQAYVQVCSEIIAEFEKIAPFKFYNGEDSVDLARESDARKELRSKIRRVDASIRAATETLENAISDLGDLTIDDVVTAYNEGKISSEERERLINSIECLQTIIQSHPQILEELKKGKIDLLNQLRDTY